MGDLVRMPHMPRRRVSALTLVRDLLEGRPRVLYLPPPRGRLAWWVRPGSVAHLAVWLPSLEEPGRWRWHLLCRHSRRHVGYWWAADTEPRCRECLRLLFSRKLSARCPRGHRPGEIASCKAPLVAHGEAALRRRRQT